MPGRQPEDHKPAQRGATRGSAAAAETDDTQTTQEETADDLLADWEELSDEEKLERFREVHGELTGLRPRLQKVTQARKSQKSTEQQQAARIAELEALIADGTAPAGTQPAAAGAQGAAGGQTAAAGFSEQQLQHRIAAAVSKAKQEADAAIASERKTSAAERALLTAGASESAVPRLLRLIDLDALEVEGREVYGLDEEIAALKADMPGSFGRQRAQRRDAGAGSGGRQGGGAKKLSAGELAAAAWKKAQQG